MKDRSRTAVVALIGIAFLSLCLLGGPPTNAAKLRTGSRESQKNVKKTSITQQATRRDGLQGQWRVKCGVRIYSNGDLLSSYQDNDASLVVAETDSDGSYQLYKFPSGFGEAFPRVRQVSANQYAGHDTVRGITTLVKQSVDIENKKITIKQTTIDTPSNKTQTDITCRGTRQQSALGFRAPDSAGETCGSTLSNDGW